MALPKVISHLHRTFTAPKRSKISGFTLLELLVAMIVSSIVVSGLLYLVVELLKTDRRETVLDQTQRDMQRALDYMSDDIREAVYIYSTPTTVTNSTTGLTDLPAGGVPVLAFWRPDPINTGIPTCSTLGASTTTIFQQCEVLKIRQSAYSLVVYLQKPNDGNANWPGKSRIIRYKLDKYSNLTTLASTTGYRDPAVDSNFGGWTRSGLTTNGISTVLVDFVDYDATTPLTDPASCAFLGSSYLTVPSTASTLNKSFFGCIRNPADESGNGNQDAYLFLKGNISGAGGGLSPVGRDSALPILQTRVLMRGVVDKNPAK